MPRFHAVVLYLVLVITGLPVHAQDSIFVDSVFPQPHVIDADRASDIVVTFSVPVDSGSISSATFRVFGKWSGPASGSFIKDPAGLEVRFRPMEPFFAGEWVTVALSKSVTSRTGDSLDFGHAWSFWAQAGPGVLDLQELSSLSIRAVGEPHIQSYGAYAGDLNDDGWTDLSVPNEVARDVRVFYGDGSGGYDGTFTVYPITIGLWPSTNEGADLNGDGFIDFVVGSGESSIVSVFMGDSTGGFFQEVGYTADDRVRGLSVMDLDGDGDDDVVTANWTGNNISMLHNNGDGTFAPPVHMEAGANQERACAAADANGDGIMDLFVGAYQSQEIVLLLGDGNGGLVFSDKVAAGGRPWMITVGDVNRDGSVDVVSANSTGNNAAVVFGDGQGSLSAAVTYPAGSFPLAIDLGDIDGDGDLDMVTSAYSNGTWTLLENDGSGVFVNPRTYFAPSAASCVVLHDRDNDGDVDLTGIDEIADVFVFFDNDPTAVGITGSGIPRTFRIDGNYPNPFNPTTTIRYALPDRREIKVAVYNVLGGVVKNLFTGYQNAGEQSLVWDGTDDRGRQVASGVYFFHLTAGSVRSVGKMLLVR